jgi:phosphoenolpyruvate-protein phosphotransferase
MPEGRRRLAFHGKTLATGLGEGKTFVYRDDLNRFDEFYQIEDAQADQEVERFQAAIPRISSDLKNLAGQVDKEMDGSLSDVFHAHVAMVEDESLRREVETEIRTELVSAGSAVRAVFRRWERRFRGMEAEVSKQKADDMQDLARRLVFSLAGVRAHELEKLPAGSVLVATRLLPSDTVYLGRQKAAAAVLEIGGRASHAALFAREIGLPCVAGIADVVEAIPAEAPALVDAESGDVFVYPEPDDKRAFQRKRAERRENEAKARGRADRPATTKGGRRIFVLANVGRREDTEEAIENGADGVGLYRIERAYLDKHEPPGPEALLEEIERTLAPAKGLPVYVRLLDIGADKTLPFLEERKESNPALGRRGIRILRDYPDLLHAQVGALIELSAQFDLHIVVPMVALPEDLKIVREVLDKAAKRTSPSRLPKLGAMVETPAAALTARDLAEHADFLSFGTNDLTQYVFAADRENAAVDAYFNDAHAAIFRLLQIARQDAPEVPMSVCGELAGRPESVPALLQCGITSLSVASPSIPSIKEAVRTA